MSDLGDRMKSYESVSATRLIPKLPVLIRLDGKAFHTLTRGCLKPWDQKFQNAMWQTASYLCEEITGCKLAYVQSDEITLLLVDYERRESQGWFAYEVQKLVSVSAGLASSWFTVEFGRPAAFDARAWNLPQHEVVNAFIWRQQDATRNSILGLAQVHFSHKAMQGKNTSVLQDMLMEKGINWNDCPSPQKRGVCIVRETYEVEGEAGPAIRHRWTADIETPIFTQDREYVERYVYPETKEAA